MTSDPAFDLGPQYPKDPPFTARMRLHQSWYRTHVLKVPYGTGPRPSNSTPYGNMLRLEDGQRGLNFLTPHIFEVAKRRIAEKKGTVDAFRLLCNLLSSQPMCFNLFGLLVDDFELATDLFRTLLPGEVDRVTKVRLEYAPEPAHEYLGDLTAFDAFVEYIRPDGKQAFIGVETKLTETFTPKAYARPEYWTWTSREDSPWPESVRTKLMDAEVNQLWRNHLLVEAMLHHPKSPYSAGASLVIYHPGDTAAIRSIESYQSLLKPGTTSFSTLALDKVVQKWTAAATQKTDQEWLAGFNTRYLDLSLSEQTPGK